MKRVRELFLPILFEIKIMIYNMKIKQVFSFMIGTFMGTSIMYSCMSEDINYVQEEVISNLSADYIAMSNEQRVEFKIQYAVPDGYKVVDRKSTRLNSSHSS